MKQYRRHKESSQRGFTLIEVLVAIGVFSIVVAIATGGFVNSLRTQRQVASLISTQSNASLVLEQMAREMRTGFLFCHDTGSTAPSDNCYSPVGSDSETAVMCDTTIDPGNDAYAHGPSGDRLPNGDLPMWDCPSIDYFNAQGAHVNYSLQNGALMESIDGNPAQSITGDSVFIKKLHFVIFGNIEGDSWTPRVTIVMDVVPSSTDPAVNSDSLNLETTVSARTIDCVPGADPSQC
jgi:prepilin-type N-terminal cleavage/methylation domain-containing protein